MFVKNRLNPPWAQGIPDTKLQIWMPFSQGIAGLGKHRRGFRSQEAARKSTVNILLYKIIG